MGAFDCVDVSHKDYTRVDESNTYCLWSVALLSCDEWPVVTSPSRYSRYVREFQAVWRLLLFICLMKYFCCNYWEGCNSRPADHIDLFSFRLRIFLDRHIGTFLSRGDTTHRFVTSRKNRTPIFFNVAWVTGINLKLIITITISSNVIGPSTDDFFLSN